MVAPRRAHNYANLNGANLSGANLNDADLNGANLSDADFVYVKYNSQTKWPMGFDPTDHIHGLIFIED